MFRQSFCYPCFQADGESLDTLCARAADIGYAGIELWFRDDHFQPLLDAAGTHGLTVASMCGHQSLTVGMNNPAEHDRIEAEVNESLDLAVEHGIPNLICFSGNRLDGQSEEAGMEACVACLQRVAPAAEQAGVNLNMELLNSKVNHPGYLCDRTAWGVAMCRRVASPRVKLLYDIYHMQIMEGDVIRNLQSHIDCIGHFHTAGNPGRHDLDDQQELYYPAICRAIADTGYTGFLAHEFTPKADPAAALQHAFDVCQVR